MGDPDSSQLEHSSLIPPKQELADEVAYFFALCFEVAQRRVRRRPVIAPTKAAAGRRATTNEKSERLFCLEGGELLEFARDDLFWKRVVGEGGALFLAGGEDPVDEFDDC